MSKLEPISYQGYMNTTTYDLIKVQDYIKFLERTGQRKRTLEESGIFY